MPKNDGLCDHLKGMEIPDISLLTPNGELIKIKRKESFRIIFYCYPMTGRSDRKLPENWNSIPGARGCTVQNISFRNEYEELIKLNALPIGLANKLKLKNDSLLEERLLLVSDC